IHRFFEFVIVFLLYYFVGPESVGIYSIALSIVGLLELVNVGVKTSIYPTVYRFYDTEEHRALRKFIPNWTKTYVAFILSASLSLLATSPILVVLTSNSSFLDAVEILPFLLLASALQIIESSVQIPYLLRKRVDLISIRQFIATVGAILLAFLLIPTFGLLGASITLSCHPFLRIILAYPLAQKLYHFDYPLYKFLLVGVNTLLALSGGYILWKIFLVRFEIAFLVPIPFFIAILFITRIITIREIKVYFRIIRSSKA
ncbi:MAG: lipopolysaccharide biosynthesis protein, partial [Candidatus Hodarchaeota archaeon]